MTDATNELITAANTVEGRIFFPGNPWPDGHRIISCELVAAINPSRGLYTDEAPYQGPALTLAIELKTADYDEDDQSDRDAIGLRRLRGTITEVAGSVKADQATHRAS